MKYKYQAGGQILGAAVANPFFGNTNQLAGAGAAGTSKTTSRGSLIDDSIMKEIIKKGITTDVNKFTDMLIDIEKNSKYQAISQSQIYKLQAYANQILNQANDLKLAEYEASKNNSLSEIAVDDRGYIFTKNEKGKLEKVHMSKYNPETNIGLTFGELIIERKKNPALVDNDTIATSLKKAVGIEQINKYITQIINAVGSADNTTEAYHELVGALGKQVAKQPTEQQQAALAEMQDMYQKLGPDAIFKITEQSKSKNVNDAFKYIFSMLPNAMRTQLQANYVVGGGKYEDSVNHIGDIIGTALTMSNDVKSAFKIDYDGTLNKAAGTKSGTASTSAAKQNQLTPLELLAQGDLGETTLPIINRTSSTLQMNLKGNGMPTFTDVKGKPTGKMILSDMMVDLATIVDQNHMQIGNQKLTPNNLSKIIYNGADVVNVWAPVNSDGDVDLEMLARLSAVQKYIAQQKDVLTTEDKNKILQENACSGYYDDRGTYHQGNNMEQFIVFTGTTSDKFLDYDSNDYAYRLKSAEAEGLREEIKTIYARSNKKTGKQEFPFAFFERATDYVNAPVFMKLNRQAQQYAGAYAGHGPAVTKPTLESQMAVEQRLNSNYQMPSSGFLLQK